MIKYKRIFNKWRDKMFCENCGSKIEDGHKFCMNCGAKVESMMHVEPNNLELPPMPETPVTPVQPVQPEVPVAPVQPVQPEAPVAPVQPVQPEVPVTPVQPIMQETPVTPVMPADSGNVPPKKKQKWPIIVIVVVILLAALGVGGYFAWQYFSEEEESESVDRERDDEDDTEEAIFSTEAEEVVSEAGARGLLEEKLNDVLAEKGNAAGSAVKLVSDYGYSELESYDLGVIGSIIQDVSGDEVEDLIVVYTDGYVICFDAYTVEDDEVIETASDYYLGECAPWDNNRCAVYLKKTKTGYNIVADCWFVANHYADGVTAQLYSYACDKNKFLSITSYSQSGSVFDQDDINSSIITATKAGLVNITTAMSNLFLVQDLDVTLIAGYTTTVFDNFDYEQYYDTVDYVFGVLNFASITENGIENKEARDAFISTVSEGVAGAINEDFILPMSSERYLTEEDVLPLLDDKERLQLARNEIYAKYGRMFDTEWIQEYFNSKPWYEGIYTPSEFDSYITLTDIETQNAAYLLELFNEKYGN